MCVSVCVYACVWMIGGYVSVSAMLNFSQILAKLHIEPHRYCTTMKLVVPVSMQLASISLY